MQPRFLAWIAEFAIQQVIGEVRQNSGSPHVAQMLHSEIDAFAHDALIVGRGRAD